ncbi:hypothetical protein R5R35_004118 [Gryllus longicercus]|uniref:Prokaryotic-type class I peptide chain release factors domain-containing protein n=1 Tax=Gryllus longicercus TaxID=2509291 RepID=A0AAN9VEG3_9ORTH
MALFLSITPTLGKHLLQKCYPLILSIEKHTIDRSCVPVLDEKDLDERFVKGSGPGGQAVNKTNNCVVLIHKPSGIVVKCHNSRLQSENRQEARKMLVEKLDTMLNGENSIQAQKLRIEEKKSKEKNRRQRRRAEMKQAWKEQSVE